MSGAAKYSLACDGWATGWTDFGFGRCVSTASIPSLYLEWGEGREGGRVKVKNQTIRSNACLVDNDEVDPCSPEK